MSSLPKCEQIYSFENIIKLMPRDVYTLSVFNFILFSMIERRLFYYYFYPRPGLDRVIFSFFSSLLRRRSSQFCRAFAPSDKDKYRHILSSYEKKAKE